MASPITSPGVYSGKHYYLRNDVTVTTGSAITLTGNDVRLDLNGFAIKSTEQGNAQSFGVVGKGSGNVTITGGKVTGFRIGIFTALVATIENVDFSGCKYIGAHLSGPGSLVRSCSCDGISGVTDEPYAIAVNLSGNDSVVSNCAFKNIYRQEGASLSKKGEGCAVVFHSRTTGCLAENVFIDNHRALPGTIGIFAGTGGGHSIVHITARNLHNGIQCGGGKIVRCFFSIDEPLPGSIGISADHADVRDNIIAGYQTPMSGKSTFAGNRIFTRDEPAA